MEWYFWMAPLPGAVWLDTGETLCTVAIGVALLPLAVTLRHALGRATAEWRPRRLRLLPAGRALKRQTV